jgi:glycosyltransferase involved in cell wall biosynthesis
MSDSKRSWENGRGECGFVGNAVPPDNGAPIGLSIIVPMHNEAGNVQPLHAELRTVVDALERDAAMEARGEGDPWGIEIIFVDDGSTDGTWEEIARVLNLDRRVQAVRLRSRRGKAVALATGFQCAAGDYLVTLDGDLQDDPREIPRLLEMAARGYDVVCGWKQHRRDPWLNVIGSKVFNRFIGGVCGLKLHDHNCGIKCLRAEVAGEIRLFGQLHRFLTVLAHSKGFRVTEIPVHHRPRKSGRSKYSAFKIVEGLLDLLVVRLLTGFMEKPFHLLGTAGLGIGGMGFAGLAYLAVYWLLGLGAIGGRPLLIYSTVALLSGLQLIALGITAELINWRLAERRERSIRKFSGKDFEAPHNACENAADSRVQPQEDVRDFQEPRDAGDPERMIELGMNSSRDG